MKMVQVLSHLNDNLFINDLGLLFFKQNIGGQVVYALTTTARVKCFLKNKISLNDLLFEYNETVLVYNEISCSFLEKSIKNLNIT